MALKDPIARAAYNKAYGLANKEAIAARMKLWREKNKADRKIKDAEYYAANKERLSTQARIWRENNKEQIRLHRITKKEDRAAQAKLYRINNKGMGNAVTAKRRAAKSQRTPSWLTQEHLAEIRALYESAVEKTKVTGVVWHVDHIIPLRGESVSGLHVPWNLRVIPAYENLSKSNKLVDV